jgi:hypothetical protein
MPAPRAWIVAWILLTARSSEASRDTECAGGWRLDAPTVADGGLVSTQCTCLGWTQYGDPPPPRYACDLCGGDGVCLKAGATLTEGCSHAGEVSVFAQVVVLLWLVRRGTRSIKHTYHRVDADSGDCCNDVSFYAGRRISEHNTRSKLVKGKW